jgi:hypothetical protein
VPQSNSLRSERNGGFAIEVRLHHPVARERPPVVPPRSLDLALQGDRLEPVLGLGIDPWGRSSAPLGSVAPAWLGRPTSVRASAGLPLQTAVWPPSAKPAPRSPPLGRSEGGIPSPGEAPNPTGAALPTSSERRSGPPAVGLAVWKAARAQIELAARMSAA